MSMTYIVQWITVYSYIVQWSVLYNDVHCTMYSDLYSQMMYAVQYLIFKYMYILQSLKYNGWILLGFRLKDRPWINKEAKE